MPTDMLISTGKSVSTGGGCRGEDHFDPETFTSFVKSLIEYKSTHDTGDVSTLGEYCHFLCQDTQAKSSERGKYRSVVKYMHKTRVQSPASKQINKSVNKPDTSKNTNGTYVLSCT